ncbi:MAG TPA: sulfotransferase family protein [Thermoanaerobaculia bacterium]|nr:sulfotransferase family protein [Thermoanaerobaculia bacterium]
MPALRRIWRRLRYGEPVVVVSGLPRSGTSMAMKMLEAGGVSLVSDGEREADVDNPKGYYEDQRVKDLERSTDRAWVREARGKGIKVISRLLRSLPEDNFYQVVLLRRELQEVLASQGKMLERLGGDSGGDDQRMRSLLEKDLWQATYHLKRAPNFEWIELQYAEVLGDPEGQARRLAAFLGRDLDVQKMATVVDPDLYRNRAETA